MYVVFLGENYQNEISGSEGSVIFILMGIARMHVQKMC